MSDKPASYAHATSPTPLLGEDLRRTVRRHGERDARIVRSQGHRATYRALWDVTTKVALGLLAHGVQKGDRVGIWSQNRWEWVAIQYATARIGAILVSSSPAYETAEIEYALRQTGVSAPLLARDPHERPPGHARGGSREAPRSPPRAGGRGVRCARRAGDGAGRAASEAQGIGVPSVKHGEEVMGWIRHRPGTSTDEQAMIAHCTGRIATYKIPRDWRFVDAFSMTVTDKVKKYRTRALAVEDLGLATAASLKTA